MKWHYISVTEYEGSQGIGPFYCDEPRARQILRALCKVSPNKVPKIIELYQWDKGRVVPDVGWMLITWCQP